MYEFVFCDFKYNNNFEMEEPQIKIRKSFVSNSSSSSFIVYGEKVTFEEAIKFEGCDWFTNRTLNCGEDVIWLTKEMIENILKHKDELDISLTTGTFIKNPKYRDCEFIGYPGFYEDDKDMESAFCIDYDVDNGATHDDIEEFNNRYLK